MSEPRAILVDDDPQQLLEASGAISEAGFSVQTFEDVQSALAFIDGPIEFVDLFVLDRKLPMKIGETKADELGDALFEAVSMRYPNARILIFSGYTDFDHAQKAVAGSGFVIERDGFALDRVTVLRKTQFDKFEEHLSALREAIRTLDDIYLRVDLPSVIDDVDKRVLRRVGAHYSAAAVKAKMLAGGLTDAKVWQCDITTPDGAVARIVAKQSRKSTQPGGLQDLLGRELIARKVDAVVGLMGGFSVSILQLAGTDPMPLLNMISSHDNVAASHVTTIATALDAVHKSPATMKRLKDLVTPFIEWSALEKRLNRYGVAIPSGELWVDTTTILSHGDLHAANILVCDGDPVLIDSDGNLFASSLADPATLLISTLVHPDSPIRGDPWPSVSQIEARFGESTFGDESPCPEWFAAIQTWIVSRQESEREFWAMILAFAARQLGFGDVQQSSVVLPRVLALVRKASGKLIES